MSLCVGGNPATRRRDWNQYRLVAYVARYRFLILFDAMAIKFFALQLQLHTYYSRRLSDRILGSCAHHWAAPQFKRCMRSAVPVRSVAMGQKLQLLRAKQKVRRGPRNLSKRMAECQRLKRQPG